MTQFYLIMKKVFIINYAKTCKQRSHYEMTLMGWPKLKFFLKKYQFQQRPHSEYSNVKNINFNLNYLTLNGQL